MRKSKIKNYWITPKMVIRWVSCKHRWPDKKVFAWFKGRQKVRLSSIMKDEKISEDDRLWIIWKIWVERSDLSNDWWAASDDIPIEDIIAKIE